SQHDHEIAPRSVQIAGSEPLQMAAAARYNVERGAQIIDINMGCPAKKVCRKAAGSALLADEVRVKAILLAVIDAVDVPVTLKIRTGSAPGARNGVSIAHIAEDAGIAALAVHGRTRACAFTGHAEYDTIAAIVAAINIPVFANGDINSPQMAAKVIAHTGAAGVMIGRAAQGRPWLCGQIATYLDTGIMPAPPSAIQQLTTLHRHVAQLHQFYGDFMGVRIARKHVGWYLNADRDMREQHRQFNRLTAPEEQLYYIEQLSGFEFNKEIAA
ncbi:MAG: tRNA dihydrouridine synthase DusB, partial [Halioglobus sp.]|nr:tRNA dihydrouridine synthase DusB [Halioglobus sp.]